MIRQHRIRYAVPGGRRNREAIEFELREIGAVQTEENTWLVEAETDTIRMLYQTLIPRYLEVGDITVLAIPGG